MLEVSKITSLFHIMKKTYLFPFSHLKKATCFFSLSFELTSYLGNVKYQSKKQTVQTQRGPKVEDQNARRQYLDKHCYCCQQPICCKYLMSLKEKKNPPIINVTSNRRMVRRRGKSSTAPCMEQVYYAGQYGGKLSPTELLFRMLCSQARNRSLHCGA